MLLLRRIKMADKLKAGSPCYFGFTTNKQWRNYIQDLLKHYDKAVIRAVIQIYKRQTFDEQMFQESNLINGVGFSKNDAPFLTTVAMAFISGKEVDKKTFEITRNKMLHYWRQLMQISKEGLDDKLKEIQAKLEREEMTSGNRDNNDNECNNSCCDNSNIRENPEDYLFPEILEESSQMDTSSDTCDTRYSVDDCNYFP